MDNEEIHTDSRRRVKERERVVSSKVDFERRLNRTGSSVGEIERGETETEWRGQI